MKRLFSLLFVLILSMFLIGCTGDSAKDPNNNNDNNQVEENEGSENGEEDTDGIVPVADLPDKDFDGLTLTWGSPYGTEIDPDHNEFSERFYNRIQELEERWNFTLEHKEIDWDDYVGNYIRTTLAGDPIADIVYGLSVFVYPNLIDNGIAYPVSDLGIIDYDDPHWNKSAAEAFDYKGKQYSLARNGISTRDGIWWNKSLFDQFGLPDLYDLYENGEWTWEKLMEVAEDATRDLDNDGEIDVYGFDGDNLAWKLIYSNGYESIQKTDSGIEIDMTNDLVIEALEFYQKMGQDHSDAIRGWLDGDEWDSRYKEFADGNIAMISGEWWIAGSYLTDDRMEGEYGFLPFPTGPSYNEPVSYGYEAAADIMLATVENPEDKVTIWDEMHKVGTEEDWERWLIEEFETTAGDRETVDFGLLLNDNTKVNLIRGFENIDGIFSDLFEEIFSGETTVQSGLEAIDPQVQAALEDFEEHGVDLGIDEDENEDDEEEE